MKRLIFFALLTVLLLSACNAADPVPTTPIQAESRPTTEAPTDSTPTAPSAEPTQALPRKVTVYLLEKSVLADSGYTAYHYDENHSIDRYEEFTIENDLRYTVFFEKKDEHGMAGQCRTQWGGGDSGETQLMAYFSGGKLKEQRYPGTSFSGTRYEYDQKGNVLEKREYYEDALYASVKYEYQGDVLTAISCKSAEGELLFECVLDKGRITGKTCYEYGGEVCYIYKYDQNGNLSEVMLSMDGELFPSGIHTYKAVEVDADRAMYLLEQQRYLLGIA